LIKRKRQRNVLWNASSVLEIGWMHDASIDETTPSFILAVIALQTSENSINALNETKK
jgi:hypothetical protein